MHQWEKALYAYKLVNLSVFNGYTSWRIDVLREQIAECTYKIGNKKEAQKMLIKIFERYEIEPSLAFNAMSISLWSLAKYLSPDLLIRAKIIEEKAFNKAINC